LNVFVDTSAIVAVLDREDSEHARANKIWDRLLDENSTLQTTNYVLIEVAALLQRRIGFARAPDISRRHRASPQDRLDRRTAAYGGDGECPCGIAQEPEHR